MRCGDLLIYDVDAAWRIEHAEDGLLIQKYLQSNGAYYQKKKN